MNKRLLIGLSIIFILIIVFVLYKNNSASSSAVVPVTTTDGSVVAVANPTTGVVQPVVQDTTIPVAAVTTPIVSTPSVTTTPFNICENKASGTTIKCSNGTIKIVDAKYGRYDNTSSCGGTYATCAGKDVLASLGNTCNGKTSCNINASAYNTVFGDPCPNILKQLQGNFTCNA